MCFMQQILCRVKALVLPDLLRTETNLRCVTMEHGSPQSRKEPPGRRQRHTLCLSLRPVSVPVCLSPFVVFQCPIPLGDVDDTLSTTPPPVRRPENGSETVGYVKVLTPPHRDTLP